MEKTSKRGAKKPRGNRPAAKKATAAKTMPKEPPAKEADALLYFVRTYSVF